MNIEGQPKKISLILAIAAPWKHVVINYANRPKKFIRDFQEYNQPGCKGEKFFALRVNNGYYADF